MFCLCLFSRFCVDFSLRNSAVFLMGAQNYYCTQSSYRYPAMPLLIGPTKFFLPYVKNKDDLLAIKKAWLKFKFENSDVLCAVINRNHSVPIHTNR